MIILGIAAESRSDAALITAFVDRLISAQVEWIEPELLDAFRQWRGLQGENWLDLHEAFRRARAQGLPVYGHFGGEAGAADAQMHRAVLSLFADEEERPSAVVVARDMDGDANRFKGWQQAVEMKFWPFICLGALCDPEIEAWLVAAWAPDADDEMRRFLALKRDLAFDPTEYPERLTAKHITDLKDAKRVLGILTQTGRDAESRFVSVSWDDLARRGARCGLSRFLYEVRDCIHALFVQI